MEWISTASNSDHRPTSIKRDISSSFRMSAAASRTDVLVYETPVLQEDVTIAGPISPRLFVSTTGTDSIGM